MAFIGTVNKWFRQFDLNVEQAALTPRKSLADVVRQMREFQIEVEESTAPECVASAHAAFVILIEHETDFFRAFALEQDTSALGYATLDARTQAIQAFVDAEIQAGLVQAPSSWAPIVVKDIAVPIIAARRIATGTANTVAFSLQPGLYRVFVRIGGGSVTLDLHRASDEALITTIRVANESRDVAQLTEHSVRIDEGGSYQIRSSSSTRTKWEVDFLGPS